MTDKVSYNSCAPCPSTCIASVRANRKNRRTNHYEFENRSIYLSRYRVQRSIVGCDAQYGYCCRRVGRCECSTHILEATHILIRNHHGGDRAPRNPSSPIFTKTYPSPKLAATNTPPTFLHEQPQPVYTSFSHFNLTLSQMHPSDLSPRHAPTTVSANTYCTNTSFGVGNVGNNNRRREKSKLPGEEC